MLSNTPNSWRSPVEIESVQAMTAGPGLDHSLACCLEPQWIIRSHGPGIRMTCGYVDSPVTRLQEVGLASFSGTRQIASQCFERLSAELIWLLKCKLDGKRRFKEVRHIPKPRTDVPLYFTQEVSIEGQSCRCSDGQVSA